MDKKELIISLMKLDWAYSQKTEAIEKIWNCSFTEAKLFNEKDNDGNKIKDIFDIVFEYAGIPEDNDDVLGDNAYCRDFMCDIYYGATYPLGNDSITFELAAEILISVGENKGHVLPKYEKHFKKIYLYKGRGDLR